MREYTIKVNKNKIESPSISLVQNDYNSTKLIFDFDFQEDYKKVFQMKLPSGTTWIKEIINNELVLADENNTEIVSVLIENGLYEYDIAIYDSNSKLTTTDKSYFNVRSEIKGENVELDDRVPILDDLINETRQAVNEADNLDIDIRADDESTIVEITRKDGTKKEAVVSGGTGGVDDYNLLRNKPRINGTELNRNKSLDDLGIQPKGDYIESEKDPTVPSYVKSIKETDISKWNNKSDFSGSYNDLKNIPSNLAKTNENNNFNASQTINGTLTINGDIVQNGESYETHAEQIYTEKNEITLRDKAVGGMSKDEFAGLIALLYNGIVSGRLGFKADGTAYVGDVGDEQPLLTRDEAENLTNGQVLVWDGTNLKAIGSSDYVKNTDVASETNLGLVKVWESTNEDGEIGLNISTEV